MEDLDKNLCPNGAYILTEKRKHKLHTVGRISVTEKLSVRRRSGESGAEYLDWVAREGIRCSGNFEEVNEYPRKLVHTSQPAPLHS